MDGLLWNIWLPLVMVISHAAGTGGILAEPFPGEGQPPAEAEVLDPQIEMLLPDLRTLPPHDLVWRVNGSGEKILRFGNSVGNFGLGPLEMHGEYLPDNQHPTVEVTQSVHSVDGESITLQVGLFEYHPTHEHWHWQGFSRYEVWSVNDWGGLVELMGVSGKVGFCLRDIDAIDTGEDPRPESWSNRRAYGSCGWKKQGLSPGWVDRYDNHLDGQSIDLSHVEDGLYALVSTTNPDQLIMESDLDNNTAVVYFSIRGREMEVLGDRAPIRRLPGVRIQMME